MGSAAPAEKGPEAVPEVVPDAIAACPPKKMLPPVAPSNIPPPLEGVDMGLTTPAEKGPEAAPEVVPDAIGACPPKELVPPATPNENPPPLASVEMGFTVPAEKGPEAVLEVVPGAIAAGPPKRLVPPAAPNENPPPLAGVAMESTAPAENGPEAAAAVVPDAIAACPPKKLVPPAAPSENPPPLAIDAPNSKPVELELVPNSGNVLTLAEAAKPPSDELDVEPFLSVVLDAGPPNGDGVFVPGDVTKPTPVELDPDEIPAGAPKPPGTIELVLLSAKAEEPAPSPNAVWPVPAPVCAKNEKPPDICPDVALKVVAPASDLCGLAFDMLSCICVVSASCAAAAPASDKPGRRLSSALVSSTVCAPRREANATLTDADGCASLVEAATSRRATKASQLLLRNSPLPNPGNAEVLASIVIWLLFPSKPGSPVPAPTRFDGSPPTSSGEACSESIFAWLISKTASGASTSCCTAAAELAERFTNDAG